MSRPAGASWGGTGKHERLGLGTVIDPVPMTDARGV